MTALRCSTYLAPFEPGRRSEKLIEFFWRDAAGSLSSGDWQVSIEQGQRPWQSLLRHHLRLVSMQGYLSRSCKAQLLASLLFLVQDDQGENHRRKEQEEERDF
jgi:hypothetical protein